MDLEAPITTWMTAMPQTVSVTDTLTDVWTCMLNGGYHHIPVVDGDRLVGMLSFTDLAQAVRDLPPDIRGTGVILDERHTVRSLMSERVTSLPHTARARDAAKIFATGRLHALPVVNGDRLVGIVTTTDLARRALAD